MHGKRRTLRLMCLWSLVGSLITPALADQLVFNWAATKFGTLPPGFKNTVSGQGQPGTWQIIEAEIPSILPTLTPNAAKSLTKPVLAQLAKDPTDEHFPMLIYEDQVFGDFTIKARFKLQEGKVEQMAGVAFRILDEKNYYYIRASALGNTFNFFKIVDGLRSPPIGVRTNIASGTWHEMSITCEGSQISATLNGAAILPQLTDTTFTSGKIGFWTKSDSVSYFSDVTMDYVPKVSLPQQAVAQAMKEYPRLLGLKVVATNPKTRQFELVASDDPTEIGTAGRDAEQKVIQENVPYSAKGKRHITISYPMRDRNGDVIAAARVVLKRFPGQTVKNALARGRIVVQSLERRVQDAKDLFY